MIKTIIDTIKYLNYVNSNKVPTPGYEIPLCGRTVYLDDHLTYLYTGVRDMPVAIAHEEYGVVVNSALLKEDYEFIDGIIGHEEAHIILEHVKILKEGTLTKQAYYRQNHFGYGRGFQLELEADALAMARGHDVIPFLERAFTEHRNRGLRLRIKAAKALIVA